MSVYTNYDDVSQNYDTSRMPIGSDKILEECIGLSGKQPSDLHVLDAGCGTGNYSLAMLDAGVGKVSLFDASSGMLGHAATKLSLYIESGRVGDIKRGTLPVIPYSDGMFDAAMLNCVIHHLDKDTNNYPNLKMSLKDVKRALVPGGILCITTTHSENLDAHWYCHLNKEASARFKVQYPSREVILKQLKESGFRFVDEHPILGSDWSKSYFEPTGPLDKAWRNQDSYWSSLTEDELEDVMAKVNEMKSSGTLNKFMEEHDKSQTVGHVAVFTARAI